MRVGIVGSCGHNSIVIRAAKEHPEILLCGICPGPAERDCAGLLKRVSGVNPRAAVYADYQALLEEADLDVIVITSYCGFHAQIAMEGLERGVHIYTEKPAATDLSQLAQLEKAYFGQKESKLSAMMLSRYTPCFQAAKKALEDGRIGKLRLISAQKSYQFGSRAGMYENPDFYGGTIPWVGSHAIDWIYWLSGLKFREVTAMESRVGNRGIGTLETTASCIFLLEEEVMAVVTLDLFRPEGLPAHGEDRLRMVGTDGVLEIRDGEARLMNSEGVEILAGEKNISPFSEFLKDIQGKPSQAVSAEEVFEVTRACLYAKEAAASGKRIYWKN